MTDVPSLRPDSGGAGAPPVTLCCAAADEAAIRQTADALVDRGHQVELAIGVETDPGVLTRAIATQRGQGLFVLCRSHALDRSAVDRQRQILRDHQVPFGRTLTLAVDPKRTRELEERVVSVLRRMVTGRAETRAPSGGSASAASDDEPTGVRRSSVDLAASDDVDSAGERAGPVDPTATPGVTTPGQPAEVAAQSSSEKTLVGPAPTPPASPLAGFDPSAKPSLPMPGAADPVTPGATLDATAGGPTPDPGRPSPSPAAASPAVVPPIAAAAASALGPYTPAPVGVHRDDSSAEFESSLTGGGRLGRLLASPRGLAMVAGVVVVFIVVVVLATMGDDKEPERPSVASATAKEPDPTPSDASSSEKSEAAAAADPRSAADERAADPAEEPPPPRAGADEDPPQVVEALRTREVRAIDIFLVAPERKGSLVYDAAVAYCGGLEVAGLSEWRVPAIGELNAVAQARMLGKSIYWSGTPGDAFGDQMLVLNVKKDRISVVSTGWDGARIVCVRPRRP